MASLSCIRNIARRVLRQAIEHELSLHFRSPQRVVGLRRRFSPYSSSCPVQTIKVELDNGKTLDLVLKDSSPDSLLPEARQVRPSFLYHPLRELTTYRQLLDPIRLGTAILYGAATQDDSRRCWLLLERVKGPLLWQLGDMQPWQEAAGWLAQFHSYFDERRLQRNANDQAISASLPHLLRYDDQFYRFWFTQAEQCLDLTASWRSPELLRKFRRLADFYDRVIARLSAMPGTFIHGEFYPSNIIVRSSSKQRRICPVDWEVAAFAPGLIDLAALSSGKWTPEQKAKLLAAYRSGLADSGGNAPSLRELIESVEYCQLHLAVQWLGWAAKWSPPTQHAHDWLAEACRLGEKLGLTNSIRRRARPLHPALRCSDRSWRASARSAALLVNSLP